MQNAISSLAALGADTTEASASVGPLPTNAHVHLPPNFSAFDNLDEALNQATSEKIAVLGGSNYYDYTVYGPFIEGCLRRGIYPVLGAEILSWMDDLAQQGTLINDPGNPGKIYICGKSLARIGDPPERARQTLAGIRARDAERMSRVVDLMEKLCSAAGVPTGLDAAKVIARVAKRHGVDPATVVLQERHAAQAFQERLFEETTEAERQELLPKLYGAQPKKTDALGVQADLRTHLMKAAKPAYAQENYLDFDDAYRLALDLGGMPCYPSIVDGVKPVTPFEATPEALIGNLRAKGVWVAEFIPNRNDPAVLERYVLAMRAAGLVVCAGTEHNTLDKISLVPTCLNGAPMPERAAAVFWEGACVAAGHQAAVLAGRSGYIAPDGRPNPEYNEVETRIAAYRSLGETVIERTRAAAKH